MKTHINHLKFYEYKLIDLSLHPAAARGILLQISQYSSLFLVLINEITNTHTHALYSLKLLALWMGDFGRILTVKNCCWAGGCVWCVLWRADRSPSCCALRENSVNGRTCPSQWKHTHTHTELPTGTSAVLQVYYCSRLLMISHPLRIEVTETLIQDSLIIASGYFYLSLNIRGAFTSPKLCLCSCFFLFLLCFHLNLYLSLCREASRDTLQK